MCDDMKEDALEASLRQTVRAQYHFRASEQGLLAWDVRRLIRLSRNLPVQAVALGDIAELDRDHWYGHGDATPTVRSVVAHCQLMMAADLAYLILLDSAGRVMDGMHRVGKALMLGHSLWLLAGSRRILPPITRIATPRRCPMTTESCPKVWLVVPCFHGLLPVLDGRVTLAGLAPAPGARAHFHPRRRSDALPFL